VVNHPANIHSPRSAHGGILPHHSWQKKVPDAFPCSPPFLAPHAALAPRLVDGHRFFPL
jgi:hypothetical protein